MAKKSKSKAVTPKVDPFLEGLMAKLLDRLESLEKKVEVVIAQTATKATTNSNQSNQSKVGVQASESKSQPQSQPQQTPRRERTLYEAICADCGKVCEVPFRPVEGRAVYCKECFGRRKSGGNRPGMPILTPAVASPKPASKLGVSTVISAPGPVSSKKANKKAPLKKAKKKKK